MKHVLLILLLLFIGWKQLSARSLQEGIGYHASISLGTPLPDSNVSPMSCCLSADYQLHSRWAAGVGVGLSRYDHWMLPLFASLRWDITRPHRFTPYLSSHIGYAVALQENVNGGFCLSPSLGVRYPLKGRQSLSLAVGYELQEYSQLITYESILCLTQYVEEISNHAITVNLVFNF